MFSNMEGVRQPEFALRDLLYGVSPFDPMALGFALAVLVACATRAVSSLSAARPASTQLPHYWRSNVVFLCNAGRMYDSQFVSERIRCVCLDCYCGLRGRQSLGSTEFQRREFETARPG